METLLGAVIGAFFSILGSIWRQRVQNETSLTLRIYEEYEAPAMVRTRVRVQSSLRNYLEREPPLSYEEIKKIDPDGYDSLHVTLHFLEKIAILYKKGYLDKKLFRATLARPFFQQHYKKYISKLIDIAIRCEI